MAVSWRRREFPKAMRYSRNVCRFVLSKHFLLGLVCTIIIRLIVRAPPTPPPLSSPPDIVKIDKRELADHVTNSNLVLIGIMTAEPLLKTRAVASYDTWVSSAPGKVLFFSSEGSALPSRPDIPVVALPGITDEYPPQRKSFAMIKYMYDNYRDQFKFFMRADDDVYIRGDMLARFLHSINSTERPLFMGQPGLGNHRTDVTLHLGEDDNLCMGGPGMMLSREALVRVAPNVECCIRNMVHPNEDVEVSRCIRRFARVRCTTNYEMKHIFFHNTLEPKGTFSCFKHDEPLTGPVPCTNGQNPTTLHPIKKPSYQYRVHRYMLSRHSYRMRNNVYQLQQRVNILNGALKVKATRSPSRSNGEWEFLDVNNLIYSASHSIAKRKFENDMEVGRIRVLDQMEYTQTIYRNATHGYRRFDPLLGVNYKLRYSFVSRKPPITKTSKLPVSINSSKYVFIRQPFLEPELRAVNVSASLRSQPERINFIVTFAGRYQTFLRFMDNFEVSCLSIEPNGTVSLTVVLFHEGSNVIATESRMELTRSRYPNVDVRLEHIVSGTFSRNLGLQRGAELFTREALLFFIDVDIIIRSDITRRIRANTVPLRQVYYPILFHQYNNHFLSDIIGVLKSRRHPAATAASNSTAFGEDAGYWRRVTYGTLAVYNGDLINAGGFNVSTNEGGFDDLRLLERFIAGNVTVFHAIDAGLVHEFHELACDMSDNTQQLTCLKTMLDTLASTGVLATYIRALPGIYNVKNTSRSIGIRASSMAS